MYSTYLYILNILDKMQWIFELFNCLLSILNPFWVIKNKSDRFFLFTRYVDRYAMDFKKYQHYQPI